MRERFQWMACQCGALFPRPIGRVPICLVCKQACPFDADTELPGYDVDAMVGCWDSTPYTPEVQ